MDKIAEAVGVQFDLQDTNKNGWLEVDEVIAVRKIRMRLECEEQRMEFEKIWTTEEEEEQRLEFKETFGDDKVLIPLRESPSRVTVGAARLTARSL